MPKDENPAAAIARINASWGKRRKKFGAATKKAHDAFLEQIFSFRAKRWQRDNEKEATRLDALRSNLDTAAPGDIEEIFGDPELPLSKFSQFLRPAILLAIILFSAFTLHEVGLAPYIKSGKIVFGRWPEEVKDWLDFTGSAVVALLAAVLAVYLVNVSNIARLNRIRALSHKGFLTELLLSLWPYRGRYCENKHIDLTFEGVHTSDDEKLTIVHCSLVITQRVIIDREQISFTLVKLNRKKEAVFLDQHLDALNEVVTIDETDMIDHFGDDIKKFYKNPELFIDSRRYTINSPVAGQALVVDESIPGRLKVTANVRDLMRSAPVDFKYELQFPLEVPGFYSFYANSPTRGFTCNLDFSRVEEIKPYFQDFLSNTPYLHDCRNDPSDTKKITVSYDRWVTPKSGVVLVWYRGQPDATSSEGPPPESLQTAGPLPIGGDS